jgi:uncharacterized membrane protein
MKKNLIVFLLMVFSGCSSTFKKTDLSNLSEGLNSFKQHDTKGEQVMETTTMLASTEGFLGTFWFMGLVFIAGAFIGAPMWNWVKQKFPWNQ